MTPPDIKAAIGEALAFVNQAQSVLDDVEQIGGEFRIVPSSKTRALHRKSKELSRALVSVRIET